MNPAAARLRYDSGHRHLSEFTKWHLAYGTEVEILKWLDDTPDN
jgi:hypothetical protein